MNYNTRKIKDRLNTAKFLYAYKDFILYFERIHLYIISDSLNHKLSKHI